jgi:hypothetical protein
MTRRPRRPRRARYNPSLVERYRAVDSQWWKKPHMRAAFSRGEEPPTDGASAPRTPALSPVKILKGQRAPSVRTMAKKRKERPSVTKKTSTVFASGMTKEQAEAVADSYRQQGLKVLVIPASELARYRAAAGAAPQPAPGGSGRGLHALPSGHGPHGGRGGWDFGPGDMGEGRGDFDGSGGYRVHVTDEGWAVLVFDVPKEAAQIVAQSFEEMGASGVSVFEGEQAARAKEEAEAVGFDVAPKAKKGPYYVVLTDPSVDVAVLASFMALGLLNDNLNVRYGSAHKSWVKARQDVDRYIQLTAEALRGIRDFRGADVRLLALSQSELDAEKMRADQRARSQPSFVEQQKHLQERALRAALYQLSPEDRLHSLLGAQLAELTPEGRKPTKTVGLLRCSKDKSIVPKKLFGGWKLVDVQFDHQYRYAWYVLPAIPDLAWVLIDICDKEVGEWEVLETEYYYGNRREPLPKSKVRHFLGRAVYIESLAVSSYVDPAAGGSFSSFRPQKVWDAFVPYYLKKMDPFIRRGGGQQRLLETPIAGEAASFLSADFTVAWSIEEPHSLEEAMGLQDKLVHLLMNPGAGEAFVAEQGLASKRKAASQTWFVLDNSSKKDAFVCSSEKEAEAVRKDMVEYLVGLQEKRVWKEAEMYMDEAWDDDETGFGDDPYDETMDDYIEKERAKIKAEAEARLTVSSSSSGFKECPIPEDFRPKRKNPRRRRRSRRS